MPAPTKHPTEESDEPRFVRVTITVPPELLKMVEREVRARDTDRSKFTRDALRRKLGITPAAQAS